MIAEELPITDLVAAIDEVFAQLELDDSIFRSPSYNSEALEKSCGLTHAYLQPVRIGRKAMIGNAVIYYGMKIHLLPKAYEVVDFESVSDIYAFIEDRVRQTRTDYLSVSLNNHKLDVDIREGSIVGIYKIGFDHQFPQFRNGMNVTFIDLKSMVQELMDT